jgi:alkanesulfonate monooxygenase SsuD/methylene tetrahydromethanopterin reductase-like flavin-dependent oxidoreductase (luciferase family)
VVAALPVCVTDDVDAARARAEQVFAIYNTLPSYRAMMDIEGVSGPKDLAVVGTEAEVRDQLHEIASVGVTDLNAGVFPGSPEENERTRAILREFV